MGRPKKTYDYIQKIKLNHNEIPAKINPSEDTNPKTTLKSINYLFSSNIKLLHNF